MIINCGGCCSDRPPEPGEGVRRGGAVGRTVVSPPAGENRPPAAHTAHTTARTPRRNTHLHQRKYRKTFVRSHTISNGKPRGSEVGAVQTNMHIVRRVSGSGREPTRITPLWGGGGGYGCHSKMLRHRSSVNTSRYLAMSYHLTSKTDIYSTCITSPQTVMGHTRGHQRPPTTVSKQEGGYLLQDEGALITFCSTVQPWSSHLIGVPPTLTWVNAVHFDLRS